MMNQTFLKRYTKSSFAYICILIDQEGTNYIPHDFETKYYIVGLNHSGRGVWNT